MPKVLPIPSLLFLLLCLFGSPVRAIVFNWDAAYGTWGGTGNDPGPGASATRNFNNDGNNTGNDVSITIANLNSGGSGFSWDGTGMVVDNSPLTGGTAQNALQYQVNDNNGTGIRTTITFNYTGGVRDVSFTLWDVDRSNGTWIDQISAITATTVGGQVIGPSSVTTGSANSQSGSGTGIIVTGQSDANNSSSVANVTISFSNSAQAISSVTFLWRNTDAGQGIQYIALHDINYTPVPEVGTGFAALAACLGATLVRRRRKSAA